MDIQKILAEATQNNASDIFIVAGRPLTYKAHGKMHTLNGIKLSPAETYDFITNIYALAERGLDNFELSRRLHGNEIHQGLQKRNRHRQNQY